MLEEPELRLIASETGRSTGWLLFFFRASKTGAAPEELLRGRRAEACWTGCRRTGCLNSGNAEREVLPTSSPKTAPALRPIRYAPDKSIAN